MTDLTYAKAVVLGVIQGLTEFLPVSSSGHLALAERWMGLPADSKSMLLFILALHLGTLAAVTVVLRRPIMRFAKRVAAELQPSWKKDRLGLRICGLAILGTIPTGLIGLSAKDFFESAFANPRWIGAGLIATGCLLLVGARFSRGRRGWRQFTWWHALAVGTAQGMAISPGLSRSGTTISAAAYCGLRRRWSAEFSFLIAFPAILGAATLEAKSVWEQQQPSDVLVPWGPAIIGTIVSFIVGALAVALLVRVVRRAKLHYFTAYCWLAGALVLSGWADHVVAFFSSF